MSRKELFFINLATTYLALYCILLQFESTLGLAMVMLLFSPFMICFLVYTILKHGKYNGPELGEDEFGYQDKRKDDLGVF